MFEDLALLPNSFPQFDPGRVRSAASYLRYDVRSYGWTCARRVGFLSHLADHGNVEAAARNIGMSAAGAYAYRRNVKGFLFMLGWEAARLLARQRVLDTLTRVAIEGEETVWSRGGGETRVTRFNSRLALALLDRTDPRAAAPEVQAVAACFDTYLDMIEETQSDILSAWELFDRVLDADDDETRERVRACLQLADETAIFAEMSPIVDLEDEDEDEDEAPVETKSMGSDGGKAPPPPLMRAPVPLPIAPDGEDKRGHILPVACDGEGDRLPQANGGGTFQPKPIEPDPPFTLNTVRNPPIFTLPTQAPFTMLFTRPLAG